MRNAGWWGMTVLAVGLASWSGAARALHTCDDLGQTGWGTVATLETISRTEGKPYRTGEAGSWYVDRTTVVLPFCNYYNSVGNYSLRSYSLSPQEQTESVEICHVETAGSSPVAVSPYAGTCPPVEGARDAKRSPTQ